MCMSPDDEHIADTGAWVDIFKKQIQDVGDEKSKKQLEIVEDELLLQSDQILSSFDDLMKLAGVESRDTEEVEEAGKEECGKGSVNLGSYWEIHEIIFSRLRDVDHVTELSLSDILEHVFPEEEVDGGDEETVDGEDRDEENSQPVKQLHSIFKNLGSMTNIDEPWW